MTDTLTLPKAGIWAIDPAHSSVGAVARHLMAAKVRGSFTDFEGTITVGETVDASSVNVTIDAGSISTGVADRDGHLVSPDFLDVENFPTITFSSTSVTRDGSAYKVDGDLTMRGVTLPVTLAMEYLGVIADPWGNEKALFSASTRLERERWGLTWNAALASGGFLVGKKFDIEIEIQAALA